MNAVSHNIKPIVIKKEYKHSIEKVFSAFSQKTAFEQWIAPSDEIGTEVLIYDFNVGGQYKVKFSVPGFGNMFLSGEFININKPNQICFTWVWDKPDIHAGINSLVTADFFEHEEYTKLVVTHENLSTLEATTRHTQGWNGTLTRLEKHLINNA